LPVLHGDVTSDGRIISGDEIAVKMAEEFKAKLIGFATNVEGIFVNGKIADKIYRDTIPDSLGEEDATGKMKGKLEKIFSLRHRCRVFVFKGEGENVKKFLEGKEIGTEVVL
ncbi:MAG: hypothetical protein QXU61_02080, partial [Archaeoglobaceae archaeon]